MILLRSLIFNFKVTETKSFETNWEKKIKMHVNCKQSNLLQNSSEVSYGPDWLIDSKYITQNRKPAVKATQGFKKPTLYSLHSSRTQRTSDMPSATDLFIDINQKKLYSFNKLVKSFIIPPRKMK